MKKAALALALCAPITAAAEPASCELMGEFAAAVMRSHQMAIPITDTLGATTSDATKAYIVETYKTPRYQSPEQQEFVIAETRDRVTATCYSQ